MKNLKINIEKNIGYLKTDVKNRKINRTVEINDDIIVDLNVDGQIVGVELLNPAAQLGIKFKRNFVYPVNFIDKLALQVKDK
ncbi:MAG: DUF2283 domain-containing protein [Ignavibacteria bacterium]